MLSNGFKVYPMTTKVVLAIPALPNYRHDFIVNLHERLKKEGYELTIVTGLNNWKKAIIEIEDDLPVKVTRCPTVGFRLGPLNINWQKGLVKSVLQEQPDKVVIMYHVGKLNHSILLLRLLMRKIPFIFWSSGYRRVDLNNWILNFKHGIKHLFEMRTAGYITYSEYFANILKEKGYDDHKIVVAQNTINVERFIKSNDALGEKKVSRPIRFLFVGAIIRLKKLDQAIRACKELTDQGYDFRFDIVGGGALKDELVLLSESLQLEDKVQFHGPRYGEEVVPFFRNADVFLLPGTGGLAINEAMAYSLPVICTPGDGTAFDLVQEDQNGYILENAYPPGVLTAVMKKFLEMDNSQIREMGKVSLALVKSKATLDNMARKFAYGILNFANDRSQKA